MSREIKGDVRVVRTVSARSVRIESEVLATSAGDLGLSKGSKHNIVFTGDVVGQTVTLPDATTLAIGHLVLIANESVAGIEVRDNATTQVLNLFPGQRVVLNLRGNGSAGGVWGYSVVWELVQDEVGTTNGSDVIAHSLGIPEDSVVMWEVDVLARRTGGSGGSVGDCGAFKRTGKFKNVGGVVTLDKVQTDFTSSDQGSWKVSFDVTGGNGEVVIRGAVNNNITWTISSKLNIL